MMINSKSIGDKIAKARKKTNLSQAELAQLVSISAQAVGKWERGESMPDILTLHRIAEILSVDLNYFSDSYESIDAKTAKIDTAEEQLNSFPVTPKMKKFDWNWDMSKGNWTDSDFSGLKNLKEKFSSSNMKNCRFTGSDLSGLILGNNNIDICDFSSSDLRNSKIQTSNISNNQFIKCSFIDAEFYKNNIEKCNFSESNFSGVEITGVNFESNVVKGVVWKFTSFKSTNISNIVFEGIFEDCHFEHCSFYNVIFQEATLLNTFFKYNERFKRVNFIDCKVDKLTYAFLKNNQANLTGITVIE